LFTEGDRLADHGRVAAWERWCETPRCAGRNAPFVDPLAVFSEVETAVRPDVIGMSFHGRSQVGLDFWRLRKFDGHGFTGAGSLVLAATAAPESKIKFRRIC